jgi:hypothetical protein
VFRDPSASVREADNSEYVFTTERRSPISTCLPAIAEVEATALALPSVSKSIKRIIAALPWLSFAPRDEPPDSFAPDGSAPQGTRLLEGAISLECLLKPITAKAAAPRESGIVRIDPVVAALRWNVTLRENRTRCEQA